MGGDGEGGRRSNLIRERAEKNPWSSREGECERNEASMRKPGGRLGDPGNPKQMQETEIREMKGDQSEKENETREKTFATEPVAEWSQAGVWVCEGARLRKEKSGRY